MPTKTIITCDSTCDLSRELLERYGVTVVPLTIVMGDKQYKDLVDVTPDHIFSYYNRTGKLAKTTAVNVTEYRSLFGSFVDQGCEVVHINISAEMSICHQNARLAAQDFQGVYPVDSRNLSTGSGLLVLRAAELAQQGMAAAEIAAQLNNLAARVDASFIVDTLEYLHKGGRCSSVAALGANLLRLKPCIEVVRGKMDVGKKYRGRLSEVLQQYTRARLQNADDLDRSRIFITHTGCDPEMVARVAETIRAAAHFDEIIETKAGCTISAHCGPNTLGVLFVRKTPIV